MHTVFRQDILSRHQKANSVFIAKSDTGQHKQTHACTHKISEFVSFIFPMWWIVRGSTPNNRTEKGKQSKFVPLIEQQKPNTQKWGESSNISKCYDGKATLMLKCVNIRVLGDAKTFNHGMCPEKHIWLKVREQQKWWAWPLDVWFNILSPFRIWVYNDSNISCGRC